MLVPAIKTAVHVVPMIYAYTTPEVARHNGWTKIGYTEQNVDKRIGQQTHTADIIYKKEWVGNAIFDDGSGETFKDKDFHAYLRKLGIENDKTNEWFHVTAGISEQYFSAFRKNRGVLDTLDAVIPYKLRHEQQLAVDKTVDYYNLHENGEFLWNAKPRFGKTLAVYDFCKRIKANKVLIVTNRPAIANSWYSDYARFLGTDSGYLFVSNVDSLKGKSYVLSRDAYISHMEAPNGDLYGCIEFVSLQDLKGSTYFGGNHNKLKEVADLKWDVLVIDEAHEGVDTYKTDVAFDHIDRKFTLHLSGTPFKALANEKFPESAIFNWTYADEQKAKRDWHSNSIEENPYATLPELCLYTYQMSEIIKDELQQGVEINGETEEYAFDLNEFFETTNGRFVHDKSVDKFLDALTTQTKFPFSTEELRNELKHTFWLLNRVDSAKALAKKLEKHPVFQNYKIVLAAGDGKLDDEEEAQKSFDKVLDAINKYDKTITLSVGQLTTGVTIPEWTAVLMLSNIKSPALYMQAAFRAQNPCLFSNYGQFFRKENAYVFDFDPARTLTIFEEFANDLNLATSDGRGDIETRKKNVKELLNFFPVIGEDSNGEMIELDAEKVLSIPRKIRSQEVVRRGFMSNYLFQNISCVFQAPQAVIDILENFTPASKSGSREVPVNRDTATELSLDENGNVAIDDEYAIGKAKDVFGEKIFDGVSSQIKTAVANIQPENVSSASEKNILESLKAKIHEQAVKPIIETAKSEYSGDIKVSDSKRLDRKLSEEADRAIDKVFDDYSIKVKTLEQEHKNRLESCTKSEEPEIHKEFQQKQQEYAEELKKSLNDSVDTFIQSASTEVVKTVETRKKETEKRSIEESIKDHLRGFSRTIPSFLMAYGNCGDVTLENFDKIIPDNVFKEVTSITLEQFRFLRDGGSYIDENTGKEEHFDGNLFDPLVFNDSIKEFLRLKKALANYFDESSTEDIFDYIPPQKTNQIFTPKWVVKKMIDMLEDENPGCFDSPDKTFIDLYMKSGLYITEIVKRLYRSPKLKALFPDRVQRLQHIFGKQVFGLAPSEIIFRISINFILGFDDEIHIDKHNLRQLDALPYAEAGTLEAELDRLFGE